MEEGGGEAPLYLVSNLFRPLSWLFVSLSLTAWSNGVSDCHQGNTLRESILYLCGGTGLDAGLTAAHQIY